MSDTQTPAATPSGLDFGQFLGGVSSLASLGGGLASVFVGFRQAKELRGRAVREAKRIRRAGNRVLGAQAVAYAHAGVTASGTPQTVRNDSIAEIEREVFRSTQGFEDAANRVQSAGILNLPAGLSDAGTTIALTEIGRPGASALFNRRVATSGFTLG